MPPEARGIYLHARDIRERAERYGVTPRKSRGQNFLCDANTVRKIVDLAGVDEDDHVVEVGPGLGSLTVGLLAVGARATAIEIEPALAQATGDVAQEQGFSSGLDVICDDALHVTALPPDATALVANLPYNVAVPVVIHLLSLHSFERVLVMVQAEVGWRVAAGAGSEHYGAPSAKLAWWGQWSVESTISRKVFWPEPRVDSVLVGMHAGVTPGDLAMREAVFGLIDAGFSTRRKMARQALSGVFGGVDAASAAISDAGLDPTSRCETWSLDDFISLYRVGRH